MTLQTPQLSELLRQLIALPSISCTDPALDQGNREVIDTLAQWLEDLGFDVVHPYQESAGMDLAELRSKQDFFIKYSLQSVDGVAEVVLFGERNRVLRVEVHPDRLAAFGLSIGEVADVLRAAQFDVPVGSFASGPLEVLVRADATVADPRRIQQLMLRDRVRLGDVADVYFGLSTPESVARLDGRMVINAGIVRQAQSNTVQISDEVNRAIERLKVQFPDLGFQVTSDDAVFIKGAIAEVLKTLALALVIVIAVIWVFFGRLGATLIPAVTIPISLIGSIAGIWAMGVSGMGAPESVYAAGKHSILPPPSATGADHGTEEPCQPPGTSSKGSPADPAGKTWYGLKAAS